VPFFLYLSPAYIYDHDLLLLGYEFLGPSVSVQSPSPKASPRFAQKMCQALILYNPVHTGPATCKAFIQGLPRAKRNVCLRPQLLSQPDQPGVC
jgi:hypothetical protein